MKIVLATANSGKIAEIKTVLDLPNLQWLTYQDYQEWPQINEDGKTFLDNAYIKARAVGDFFKFPALADDSGLEVDALGGRPGIESARFAGPNAKDTDNVAKLLGELKVVSEKDRKARFVAVIVILWPDGRAIQATGICPGSIALVSSGKYGFGYDPVFVPDGYDGTMAELRPGEKNSISHRGQALRDLRTRLEADLKN